MITSHSDQPNLSISLRVIGKNGAGVFRFELWLGVLRVLRWIGGAESIMLAELPERFVM
ncbi:hypothetical protein GCM10026986_01960 [Nitrincola alkalisediminis]